jgi:small subunit ribosomal protein S1
MEIYNQLETTASKEFEKLLSSQLSKTKIIEGKIIEGKITKITDKFVFLFIEGLKSEPMLDINELKTMGMLDKIKLDENISVLLERIEDKNGEVLVSASKAQKIFGWNKLVEAYEKELPINVKIISKCKGGVIAEHVETKSLTFMPGSQISDKPLKDISHLMGIPIKAVIIKLDRIRGNCCTSRRAVISSGKKVDKAKIVEKFKVGDIIKNAIVKGYSSFGCFFDVNSELDVLVHLQEISYSRINHPEEVFTIGEKHDLLVITVDKEKLQVGCSIKQLSKDPFENVINYELNKKYNVKVVKLMEFGAFCELEPGLSALLHTSELSWNKKNVSAKQMFKIGDEITCIITEIDKDKRRVAISHRLTQENPFDKIQKDYPVGSEVEGIISSINEYAIYLKLDNIDIEAFLHANDLTYSKNSAEELKKYKNGDRLKVKVLEIKSDQQKIRIGLKQMKEDPFATFFNDKKVNDTVTVQVISSDNKGLLVKPEGSEIDCYIKKSHIAINMADARPSRFVGSERIDAAIAELDMEKGKVTLSIKLLEELQNKEAVSKFSSPLSGKNLPFSSLFADLGKKKTKKE